MLAKLGHEVDTVSNGMEAVQAVHQVAYDVVLMDIQMPLLDGLGATEHIRTELPDHRQPRIVAVSASVLVEDQLASTQAGMDAFLSKPLRLRELGVLLTGMTPRPPQTSMKNPDSPCTADARADGIRERLVELAGPEPSEDHLFFGELLRSLAARAPRVLDDIEVSVSKDDFAAVAHEAHSLKGSVANLGGKELARQLEHLEQRARLGQPTDQYAVARARDELISLCSSFLAVADDLDRQAQHADAGHGL